MFFSSHINNYILFGGLISAIVGSASYFKYQKTNNNKFLNFSLAVLIIPIIILIAADYSTNFSHTSFEHPAIVKIYNDSVVISDSVTNEKHIYTKVSDYNFITHNNVKIVYYVSKIKYINLVTKTDGKIEKKDN